MCAGKKERAAQVGRCVRVGTRGGLGTDGGPNPSEVRPEETVEKKKGNVEGNASQISTVLS
jgi:hypothetical protein